MLSLEHHGIKTLHEVRLAQFTTFRIGGPCPALFLCEEPSHIIRAIHLMAQARQRYVVLGSGSNVVVADKGLDACVVRFESPTPQVEFQDGILRVSGCTLLDDLVRAAVERGYDGLMFLSGIPGTVGGAIAGNAGAFGQAIGDVLDSVKVLDNIGRIKDWNRAALEFRYRDSILKETRDIVLWAKFTLKPGERGKMIQERRRILDLRREKHPDWKQTPCAGSIFRNVEPTSKAERRQAAGWFLEQAGVKGFKEGGAAVFPKHANIIIADDRATARDVYVLSERMKKAVKDKFGLDLVKEVLFLGEF